MANATVMSASNRIERITRDLMDRWADVCDVWNDEVRLQFERNQIQPLEAAARTAANGMQTLAEVLERVKADCYDHEAHY